MEKKSPEDLASWGLVQDVIEGRKTLLKCVEELGPKITSPNVGERSEAVEVLSKVVKEGSASLNWTDDELNVITEFFIAKLKDHHSLVPVTLDGILALAHLNLPAGAATRLVQSLFSEVPAQSQQQKDRLKFYLILRYFLRRKIDELKPLGFDFVSGFIQSVDGERDPRNLVVIFSLVPIVATEFPLGPFAEELFEVLACYFPIEFTPPPNDPYGVTKEELKEGLQVALCSSPSFAEFCLNLIIEKLESDLVDAKLDSFSLLEHAVPKYKPKDIDPFLDPIWLAVRRELFAGSLGDVEKRALVALTAVLRSVSDSVEVVQNGEYLEIVAPQRSAFKEAVDSMIKQCLHHLSEPEHKLMYPSAQGLLAMARSSEVFMKAVVSRVMPLLTQLLLQRTSHQERFTITDIVCLFLLQCRKAIRPYLLQTAGLLFSFLSENDEKIVGAALRGLTICFEDLEEVDKKSLVEHLLGLGTSESSSIREEVRRSLSAIAQQDGISRFILDHVYTPLINRLQVADKEDLEKLLALLSPICRSADMIEDLTERLPLLPETVEDPIPYIKCLEKMCKAVGHVSDKFRCSVWSVNICESYQPRTPLDKFTNILVHLSALVRTYCATLHEQDRILNEATVLFEYTKGISADGGEESLKNERKVLLLEAAYGSFRHLPDHTFVADLVFSLARTSADEIAQTSASRLYGALLNKSDNTEFVEKGVELISQQIETPNHVTLLSWGCKGLAMRGHESFAKLLDVLLNLLSSELGGVASEGFKILMDDTVECLNSECHAKIRFLYKQRVFQLTLQKLIKLYNEEEGERKTNVVMALMNQLPHIPHTVLAAHLKELLPLIVMSLQTSNGKTAGIASILSVLNSLIREVSDLICPYASTIATRLLDVARNSDLMANRKAALVCIQSLSTLPDVHILPIREEVLKGLAVCLGDKKRIVRQAAAEARNMWFLFSQPGRKK